MSSNDYVFSSIPASNKIAKFLLFLGDFIIYSILLFFKDSKFFL